MKARKGFVETEAQFRALLRWQKEKQAPLDIVAVTPEADYAAECAGVRYQTIEDLYSEAQLVEKGVQNFDRVARFCEEFDRRFHTALADFPEGESFSAQYFAYDLKILMDALLHRTFTLNSALSVLKPKEIISFEPFEEQILDDLWFRRESVAGHVLPLIASHCGYSVVRLPAVTGDDRHSAMLVRPEGARGQFRAFVSRLPGGNWAIQAIRTLRASVQNTARRGTQLSGNFTPSPMPTLIVVNPYAEADIVKEWIARGGRVIYTRELLDQMSHLLGETDTRQGALKCALARFWDELCQNQKFWDLFEMEGINAFPVARRRLSHFVMDMIPRYLKTTLIIRRLLSNTNKAVLVGICPLSVDTKACFVEARRSGIPTVVLQHGGAIGYCADPNLEWVDLQYADYYFCYGDGVAEHVAQSRFTPHSRGRRTIPVSIGSSALDRLARHNVRTKDKSASATAPRRVVYVGQAFLGDVRDFSHLQYPEIWYWRLQRELIHLFSQFPQIHFYLKLYPRRSDYNFVREPIDDWLKRQNFRNCEIIRDVPFIQTLAQVDLIIIDVPSTTLLQALTTNKKIIVLADRSTIRFDQHAAELLKKRAVLSETKEQFLRETEMTLSDSDWTLPEPVNDEFLRAYGTHLNDGRSAERAADNLFRLNTALIRG